MVVREDLEAFEAVVGRADGELEASSSRSGAENSGFFLPFLFSVVANDNNNLHLCVSDFHARTWQSKFSVQELQLMRDDVGIGGCWDDFLTYMRTALSSSNVKVIIGGAACGAGGNGAGARMVAQKTKGTPRLSLKLVEVEGSAAEDARAFISLGLFEAFRASSSALVTEREHVAGLKAVLASDQAKLENLQEQMDALAPDFMGRKKQKRYTAAPLPTPRNIPYTPVPSLSQPFSQDVVFPSPSPALTAVSKDEQEAAKVSANTKRLGQSTAAASRRNKRRGTTIGERSDI